MKVIFDGMGELPRWLASVTDSWVKGVGVVPKVEKYTTPYPTVSANNFLVKK